MSERANGMAVIFPDQRAEPAHIIACFAMGTPAGPEEYVPRSVLVTGGCGFIGSHVLDELLAVLPPESLVVCYDSLEYAANLRNLEPAVLHPNFSFVYGDIRDPDALRSALTHFQVDTVMHFAAESHVDTSFGNSLDFTSTNVVGTHTLLQVVKELGPQVRRFVHVSTDEVYGEGEEDGSHSTAERTLLRPTNPYAASKAAAEMLVHAYVQSYDMPAIITRGNNVYGPRQYPEKLIPKFTLQLLRGLPCTLHGDGTPLRSFMHVSDTARAFVHVVRFGRARSVYNIGTTFEVPNLEVTRQLVGIVHGPDAVLADHVVHVPDRCFNDKRYRVDSRPLRQLGWEPRVAWEEGLPATVAWIRAHTDYWDVEATDHALASMPTKHCRVRTAPLCLELPPERPWLVYGASGWIGGHLMRLLAQRGLRAVPARARLERLTDVRAELDEVRPARVLLAAGLTGRPNVDWCEDHADEVLRVNLHGSVHLVEACARRGVHVTNFTTGCLYTYDEAHPPRSGRTFTEQHLPNFRGSLYSRVKALAQQAQQALPNVLQLRLRMPISDEMDHPRNLVRKLVGYERVIDVPNSVTLLPELLPVAVRLAERGVTGVLNFVNPGAVSHNEVLRLYQRHVDPSVRIRNFSTEEQRRILKADRSNCELSADRLMGFVRAENDALEAGGVPLCVRPAHEAVEAAMLRYVAGVRNAPTPGESPEPVAPALLAPLT